MKPWKVESEYHIPVLLNESLDALISNPEGVYVDVTYGGGGHSRAILKRISPSGRLVGMDQDADALENEIDDDRFEIVHGNFRFLAHYLRYMGIHQVHGILADLGVSSYQLDEGSKGFSFSKGDSLDMRMNQAAEKSALDIVNNETEIGLVNIFSSYGEVRNSKSLARAIVAARESRPISNSHEFLHCVEPLAIGHRPRYLAQVFQAIRIKVNDEINALEDFLEAGADMLVPGGRLVVLTYHSIEDRVVKHFIKNGKSVESVNRKPILASAAELKANSRARSAKLRIAEKI
ncbi:UNVERIFIED_CONTAM: hypothetical protein GTU68_065801 [Idotea baltica]|nr:hypothetical protein [Idotea baltica]